MTIAKLTTEDLDGVLALWQQARDHDRPGSQPYCRRQLDVELADGRDTNGRIEYYLIRSDGQIRASLRIELPDIDDTHTTSAFIIVHPDHRRQGLGTRLLDFSVRRCREAGRTRQMAHAIEAVPGGPQVASGGKEFLEAAGFTKAHEGLMRQLDLSTVDLNAEQELLDQAWAKAAGYELVQWVGDTPEEYLPGAAALWSRLISDVPWGDLDISGWQFDTQRVRDEDAQAAKTGRTMLNTYVRHAAGGELVAHSVLAANHNAATSGFANQWITLVHPDHRGHRLGMIVKIENHRLLRQTLPQVHLVETVNATVNDHMIGINEQLGFTVQGRTHDFQRDI